ncbi:MAG TPA: serine/threonine-protein kinase [Planctomycetaceae bacterium]|nr:serine/threonine-protein kinase [Planctomycetaceae bacterium]
MEQRLQQFVQSLSGSGLLSPEELSRVVRSLSQDDSCDVRRLKECLVEQNKLTRFQVEAVQHGMVKRLFLGDYILLERIGMGGMGFVYKAKHRFMSRVVAIKVLPEFAVRTAQNLKRFQREVRAAASLEHPNIVPAYDAGECGGSHFLVMQYIDGPNLKQRVDDVGPLNTAQAVDCLIQAARGLAYAHQKGVVHRDMKPSNLLLSRDGVIKILDMGLARLMEDLSEEDEGRLTQPGQLLGTVDYVAPEQILDTHEADARSDVYSLGCTLHYLRTGAPPYTGSSIAEVLYAHEQLPPPPLPAGADDDSQILAEIYQLMMQKSPADRYQNMNELIADLELIHNTVPVWGSWTDSPPSGPSRGAVSNPTAVRGGSLTSEGRPRGTSTVDEHTIGREDSAG